MREIQLEKKIYKRLGDIDRDMRDLIKAHYQVINVLIPEVKPTKREIAAIRSKGKLVSLEEFEKRLDV